MSIPVEISDFSEIFTYIRKYPQHVQIGVLKYFLAYKLKDQPVISVMENISALLRSLDSQIKEKSTKHENVSTQKSQDLPVEFSNAASEIMTLLGLVSTKKHLDQLDVKQVLQTLNNIKSDLDGINKKAVASIPEGVNKLQLLQSEHDNAMNASAQEMLDRILDSVNPAKASRYLDQSIDRKGINEKADMYDALCEKYEQLHAYHENGRMLKDFKRSYRNKIKKAQ